MERKVKGKSFKDKEEQYVPEGMITSLVTPFDPEGELVLLR